MKQLIYATIVAVLFLCRSYGQRAAPVTCRLRKTAKYEGTSCLLIRGHIIPCANGNTSVWADGVVFT